MKLNLIGFYTDWDGYGRFNSHLVKSLRGLGVEVKPLLRDHIKMPEWLQEEEGIDWDNLTVTCLPPFMIDRVPGRHIAYTMYESSRLGWEDVQRLNTIGVEHLLVPSQDIADDFKNSGVLIPISVVPGGTDPHEFPLLPLNRQREVPYTFFTINDRGFRKGFAEVWEAFYVAFGGKTSGNPDVRLIVKSITREDGQNYSETMQKAIGADERVEYQIGIQPDIYELYAQADCLVLPSRYEGWGMPHREAACMGLPVISTSYSGLNDGFTEKWALVVPGDLSPVDGLLPDIGIVADYMRWCYENREEAALFGQEAGQWIRDNQTWCHTAEKLLEEIT